MQATLAREAMQRLPRLAELVLVLTLAWMVAGWLVGGNSEISRLSVTSGQSGPALPEISALTAVPLFGEVAKAVVQAKPVAAVVQPSRLNIKLLGTVVGEDHAAAIVQLTSSREQNVFFVGDSIQPGVKLQAVEAEAIVVERSGVLERISMEEGAALISSAMPAPVGITPAPSMMRRGVSRNQLQSQISDFPKLLSQARVIPHFLDGKSDGFVITDIVPGSLYGQVGLQNGDIIRKVNGQQVTSAEQAMAMYQALQNAPSIDLELMRAGQVQQVHYDVR